MLELRSTPPQALAALAMPALCIAGLQDIVVDPDAVRALASALPRGSFEGFEASGHSPCFERASRFDRLFEAFLE